MGQFARGIRKKISNNLGDALIVLGIMALAAPLVWSLRSSYLQEREEEKWSQPPSEEAVVEIKRVYPSTYWPPTKIVIEKIGLTAVVVEGKSDKDLERGPMHLQGTAGPGQRGNCCIAAHKEKWFKKLRKLEPGDPVVLKTHQKVYTYVIQRQKTVDPKDVHVLKQSGTPTLTLITCTGVPYGGSKYRLLATGVLKGSE